MGYKEYFVPGCNSSSRNGWEIMGCCDHITADNNLDNVLNWFKNPKSEASAHYVIDKDGTRFQCVKEGDKAWTQGQINKPSAQLILDMGLNVNPNFYLLSTEYLAAAGEKITEDQFLSGVELKLSWLSKYKNLKPDRYHIIGHYEIDSINRPFCPGKQFPYDRQIECLLKTTTKLDTKNYDLCADQILDIVSNSPESWKKCLNALENIGKLDTVGDLNPADYIRQLIEKVWKYK